ncbi:MAG: FAD-dependent monooxygenase [Aeromonas sp.]
MPAHSVPPLPVIISGGGLVGASAALTLADAGWPVCLIEPAPPAPFDAQAPFDLRVSALTAASVAQLTALQVWPDILAMRAHPFSALATWERAGMATQFLASEVGRANLGYMVENHVVQRTLWARAVAHPKIEWLTATLARFSQTPEGVQITLHDGRERRGQLLLGCDGAHSPVRTQAGIGLTQFDYRQHCLLISVAVKGGDCTRTWQAFQGQEAVAYLPLGAEHASLVWYAAPERIRALAALSARQLEQAIGRHFPHEALGDSVQVLARGTFALTRRHAQRYGVGRVWLLGDAAHTIHPLAGQGVNLGFKDVAALGLGLAPFAGSTLDAGTAQQLLSAYERARRPHNLLMQSGMDLFYHTFKSQLPPLKIARNLGLLLADRAGPLKRSVLRYALGL